MSAPAHPAGRAASAAPGLVSRAAKREDRHVSLRGKVRLVAQTIEHPEILPYTRIRKSPFFCGAQPRASTNAR
jgi:hypothetical protein